jgi:hypothetical protein
MNTLCGVADVILKLFNIKIEPHLLNAADELFINLLLAREIPGSNFNKQTGCHE